MVEVLSPSTRRFDLIRKGTDYAQLGTVEYWAIGPEDEIVLVTHRGSNASMLYGPVPENDGAVLTSPTLPDFSLIVAELFVA